MHTSTDTYRLGAITCGRASIFRLAWLAEKAPQLLIYKVLDVNLNTCVHPCMYCVYLDMYIPIPHGHIEHYNIMHTYNNYK